MCVVCKHVSIGKAAATPTSHSCLNLNFNSTTLSCSRCWPLLEMYIVTIFAVPILYNLITNYNMYLSYLVRITISTLSIRRLLNSWYNHYWFVNFAFMDVSSLIKPQHYLQNIHKSMKCWIKVFSIFCKNIFCMCFPAYDYYLNVQLISDFKEQSFCMIMVCASQV